MDKQDLTRHGRRALAAVFAIASLFLLSAGSAAAATPCTKVAAPGGSDSASGTDGAPYASAQKLVASLGDGETGCLRQGTYGGEQILMTQPGTTLRSYPGERATLTAFLELYPGASQAHVSGLRFDSRDNGNGVAVKLNADDAVFSDNEVTKSGNGVCILAGSWTHARGVVIERNRIHDCGPAGSKYGHQIYLAGTRGAVVRWNILSGNRGGWGVQMYPGAQDTVVEHNIIDGNYGGVVFASESSDKVSTGNQVRNNAITYPSLRGNVEGSWDGPVGTGNSADRNCVYSTVDGGPSGIGSQNGFSAQANAVLDGSPYADRSRGDYRFRSDSPCAALVGDVVGAIEGHPSAWVPPLPVQVVLQPVTGDVKPARKLVLRGRVKGRVKVSKVALQRRGQGRWQVLKSGRVDRRGRFTMVVRAPGGRRSSTIRFRAVVPKTARSRTVLVHVRP